MDIMYHGSYIHTQTYFDYIIAIIIHKSPQGSRLVLSFRLMVSFPYSLFFPYFKLVDNWELSIFRSHQPSCFLEVSHSYMIILLKFTFQRQNYSIRLSEVFREFKGV